MNGRIRLVCCLVAVPLAAGSFTAGAQNIYKCVSGGAVTYTDQPCTAGKGEVLHQASAAETIDHYLRMGQPQLAAAWAKARHLDSLYTARLALYDAAQEAKARQAEADAAAAKAAAAAAQAQQQQAMAAAQVAETDRLAAENTRLRAQNEAYQNYLSQPPVYYMTGPAYSGGWNGGWNGVGYPHRPSGHDHDHPPSGHDPRQPLRPTPAPPPPGAQRPPPVQGYSMLRACGTLQSSGSRC